MNSELQRAIEYPAHLPVSAARTEIFNALSAHQVLILQSETGSGKSTQIPKMLLEFLNKEKPRVALTQPRRIATKLLAQRLNQELSGGAARWVGWQVRFEKQIHAEQVVKVMTEGVLWQELLHQPLLKHYDALILDEVHERSINMDLLIGALQHVLKKRPEFKLILLSATLSAQLFQDFFKRSSFIQLPGRSYPIEDRYCPAEIIEPLDKMLWAIDESAGLSGDILAFCSTEAEIIFYSKKLQLLRPDWEYCCLYARMMHQQQRQLFQTSSKRRIILSTNVAETSLTLPGVRIVIDLGFQKILQFHPQYRVNSYPIVPISRQSITQRRGRAGRTQAGWCFHLYTELEERQRPESLPPEIQRSSLSQVVLQVLCLRPGPVENFPFISPPSLAQLKEAVKLLRLLGLIDQRDKILPQGREVARYPVDPRFCMILFEAQQQNCAHIVAIIVAFLSGDDPRVRPIDEAAKADKAHLKYHDLRSDFMSILSLWIELQSQKDAASKKDFQKYCQQHYLNPVSIRSWELQVKQLIELFHIPEREITAHYVEENFLLIHRALLAGFYDRLYHKMPKKTGKTKFYAGPHGAQAYIHPSSVLKDAKSEWVFAVSQQHDHQGQTRLRWVGPVELTTAQKYLEKHMIFSYAEPFFAPETGEVMIYKRGHAWGLPILPAVAELYRLIEPQKALAFICDHFIRLWAENDFKDVPQWAQAYETAYELSHRSRHFNALLDEAQIAEKIWKQQCWPEMMVSRAAIERHLAILPRLKEDFFLKENIGVSLKDFPNLIKIDGHQIAIEYDKDEDDFLHYTIPATCWRLYQPSVWLIVHPYFGPRLIECLLEQLPKKQKQHIGCLKECAQFFCDDFQRNKSLIPALIHFLFHYYDVECAEQSFKIYQIPRYLLPHFWIENGQQIDYIGVYQFDDDKQIRHRSLSHSAELSPWQEIIVGAQRGVYRLYDDASSTWYSFPQDQYWSWKALLYQKYAQKIWAKAKPQHQNQGLRSGFMIPSEKTIILRGIYLGLARHFKELSLEEVSEEGYLLQDARFFQEYNRFSQEFSQELEPQLHQLLQKKWPIQWQRLKNALEHRLWMTHLSSSLFQRWRIWLQSLDFALEKAERKPHLMKEWETLWLMVCRQSGQTVIDLSHPAWAVAFEGIVALFNPSQAPLVPWSEKKLLKLIEQTHVFKKAWP